MTEKENARLVFEHKIPKWLPRFEFCMGVYFPVSINERPAVWDGYDWFGVHWIPDKFTGGLTAPEAGQVIISDLEHWKEELKFPDLETIDWEVEAEKFREASNENTLSLIIMEMGIFERFQLLLGFEEAMCAFYEYPDETEELLEALLEFKLKLVEKISIHLKPDCIMYMDDLGTQNGLLVSPDTWEAFIMKKDAEVIRKIKEQGAIAIYHCCGKIDSIFEKIVQMGADGYHSVQPTNDTKMLKEVYGKRIVLIGGIDNQGVTNRPNVTEEEIRQEVRRAVDLFAPGGGYICGDTDGVCLVESSLKIIQDEYEKCGRNYYFNEEE